MKGTIPSTAKIILECDEPQLRLITNKVINQLETSVLLEIKTKKVRLKIVITEVCPPEQLLGGGTVTEQTNFKKTISDGISKIVEFRNNLLHNDLWILTGYINGNKKVPIVIMHHKKIDLTIYTTTKEDSSNKKEESIPGKFFQLSSLS